MVITDLPDKGSKERLTGRFKKIVTKAWSIRFIRFIVVSGINTLFGYTIYSIFILLNTHYAIASLLSTTCGVIFNFFTTGRIVFHNKNSSLIFRFFLVYGITYLVNLFALSRFDAAGFNMLVAGAIMLVPSAILSYFLNKKLVFQEIRVENDLKGDK